MLLAVLRGAALVPGQELGHGHLHGPLLFPAAGRCIFLSPVVSGNIFPLFRRQNLLRQLDHLVHLHIAHTYQHHIAWDIEGPVAVVEHLGGDGADTLHRSRHRHPNRALPVEALHEAGIYLPLRVILRHADLLGNDALLLGHALLSKPGDGYEAEQNAEIVVKVFRGFKVVGGHGAGG